MFHNCCFPPWVINCGEDGDDGGAGSRRLVIIVVSGLLLVANFRNGETKETFSKG